jgi:hypothetical protein
VTRSNPQRCEQREESKRWMCEGFGHELLESVADADAVAVESQHSEQ